MPDAFTSPNPALVTPGQGAILALFGSWQPPATMTVPVAERVRFALMRACRERVPWQISGKDDEGRPRIGHDHLFFVPFASERARAGAIDRILLWARNGFEPATLAAIEAVTRGGGWLRIGSRPRLRLEVLTVGHSTGLPVTLIGPARVWRSATPFVPPRYCRARRGELRDTPEQQLVEFARACVGTRPCELNRVEGEHWPYYVQQLRHHRRRPGAAGWILHFAEPVCGPLVFGGDSHYGLGRFEAVV